MTKIPAIGKSLSVSGVIKSTPKQTVKIGKSGLPFEEPLDTFEKEQQIINMLDPSTPFNNALNTIQTKLFSFKK